MAELPMESTARSAILATLLILSVSLAGCTGLSATKPRANITSDVQEVNLGGTVNFDARESSTPEPTIIDEYQWDFDDGTTRSTKIGIVSHTFQSAGNHEVEVSVVNDRGEIDRATMTIYVNAPPTIEIISPEFVRTGDTASLDASASSDPEGGNIEFIWDFDITTDSDGDSNPANDADSTASSVEILLDASGNHSGQLTVVDDKGAITTEIWTIRVITRTFKIIWEEQTREYEWSGNLAQGESVQFSHEPGEGARLIQVNATLTLARDILPFTWPEDNFTLSLNVPLTGWQISSSTTHENVTENASTSIDRGDLNVRPNSDYTVQADSSDGLMESLLNEPGQRFGQGEWVWTITADECDPDIPIDGVDPDPDNDWNLIVEYIVLIPRVSEIGI